MKLSRKDQRAEFIRSWIVAELFDAAYRATPRVVAKGRGQ